MDQAARALSLAATGQNGRCLNAVLTGGRGSNSVTLRNGPRKGRQDAGVKGIAEESTAKNGTATKEGTMVRLLRSICDIGLLQQLVRQGRR